MQMKHKSLQITEESSFHVQCHYFNMSLLLLLAFHLLLGKGQCNLYYFCFFLDQVNTFLSAT